MLVAGVALPLAPAALHTPAVRRRDVVGAAAGSSLLVPTKAALAATSAPMVTRVDSLVWNRAAEVNPTSCVPANARKAFGPKFVNYLARFLLAYDSQTRRLWRERARELPFNWDEKKIAEARVLQLGELAGSIELSLCEFTPAEGKWADPLTPKDAARVRQLLTLLRSRYGNRSDALRQLALLFSLLPPGVQPTSTIEALVAEQEDRETSGVIVIDGGSLVLSDNGLLKGLPPPALPKPAAPTSMKPSAAKAAKPFLRPTGRVLTLAVTSGGSGYDPAAPPLVSLTAPLNGGRAAQARSIVGKDGKIVALELTDEGAGYRDSDKVKVAIAPPPKSDNRRKSNGMYGRLTAAGKALLEFEVGSVSLASAGVGYGSSQNLDLRFFSGNKSAPSKAPESFATPSPAELAERPWSIENIAGLYGDRVSARSTSDVLVLRPPSATLVLGATRNAPRPRTSPSALGAPPRLQRPPPVPAAPRDNGAIGQLLALLPPSEGAPIFSPGRPPSKQYPLGQPPIHRFPSLLYERIVDDYVAKAPLKTPTLSSTGGLASLPTSVSGGIRQDVPLTPALVGRLTLAGGLCSAVTRAAITPIELRKTRAQVAQCTSSCAPPELADDFALPEAAVSEEVKEPIPIMEEETDEEEEEGAEWLGLDASFATGFGLGAGSFGTYELLKRSLPPLTADVFGPAAPAVFATPILLLACLVQAAVGAACAAPFETARCRVMAGGAGAPATLPAALRDAAEVDGEWDVARLFDGLPALLGRELPFGVTKLLTFVAVQDTILTLFPAARERPAFALAASLVAGVSSGLASAFVSQPADTVVTRLAVTNATDVRAAIDDVLSDAPPGDRAAQAKLLYAGVAQRMASTAIIVTAQFILFDGLRALLAVSKDDLSVVLDVFKDRISLYEGWDEISESWIEAVDTLDDDLDLR